MNDIRRKKLDKIARIIEGQQEALEELLEEEEEARDKMIASMRDSDRYEKSELACSRLDDAIVLVESAVESIMEAIE